MVHELGGPDAPGVGFSFGVERIVSVLTDDGLLEDKEGKLDAYVMPIGVEAQAQALNIATSMRLWGFKVDMCFDDVKLGNMFKRAEKKGARLAIIIGEDEIKNNKVIVKNMDSKEQIEVPLDELEEKCGELLFFKQNCCKEKKESECCEGGVCRKEDK